MIHKQWRTVSGGLPQRENSLYRYLFVFVPSLVVFFVAVAGTNPAPAQVTAPNDHIIVPGVRVGPFQLGMPEADLVKLGKPNSLGAGWQLDGAGQRWDASVYCYWAEHVCAWVAHATGTVVEIQLGTDDGDCRGYHTTENLGCGNTLNEVQGSMLWGTPTKYYYNTSDANLRGKLMIAIFWNRGTDALTRLHFVPMNWTEASPISSKVRWIELVYTKYDFYSGGKAS